MDSSSSLDSVDWVNSNGLTEWSGFMVMNCIATDPMVRYLLYLSSYVITEFIDVVHGD
jgi:hypothetical protein